MNEKWPMHELTKFKKLIGQSAGAKLCQPINNHKMHQALRMHVGVDIPSKHLQFLFFLTHQKCKMDLSTFHRDQHSQAALVFQGIN